MKSSIITSVNISTFPKLCRTFKIFETSKLLYPDKKQSIWSLLDKPKTPILPHKERPKQFEQQSTIMPSDQLAEYLTSTERTFDELLNTDIRTFPVEHRLICLGRILQTSHKSHTIRSSDSHNLGHTNKFLETSCFNLGINPNSAASLAFAAVDSMPYSSTSLTDSWPQDERFQLLLLSNISGAKNLSRPRLLVLAACLRQLSNYIDPKAFASVLRLITHQINEASPSELVYIGSLLNGLPEKQTRDASAAQPQSNPSYDLEVEADLLREALALHIHSRVLEIEDLGVFPILRLAYDFGARLSPSSKTQLLSSMESVVSTRVREQSLFSLCLICCVMQRMKAFRPGLIRRCLGQLRRKLHLTSSHSMTDQSSWLSAALASLANLATGGNSNRAFDVTHYARLPFEHLFLPKGKLSDLQSANLFEALPGLDIHDVFTADWVRQLLFDVGDYVADRPLGHDSNLKLIKMRTSLSLLELGVRHQRLIDDCTNAMTTTTQASTREDAKKNNLISVGDVYSTYVDLFTTKLSDVIWEQGDILTEETDISFLENNATSSLIRYLPRLDWQLYYRLASGFATPIREERSHNFLRLNKEAQNLFIAYSAMKGNPAEILITQLQSRIDMDVKLEMLPFHFIEISPGELFFADILFRKQSSVDTDVTKYAIGFICWRRDTLCHRPFQTLLSWYRKHCPIPVLPILYCDWVQPHEANQRRNAFLTSLARILQQDDGLRCDADPTKPLKTFLHL